MTTDQSGPGNPTIRLSSQVILGTVQLAVKSLLGQRGCGVAHEAPSLAEEQLAVDGFQE